MFIITQFLNDVAKDPDDQAQQPEFEAALQSVLYTKNQHELRAAQRLAHVLHHELWRKEIMASERQIIRFWYLSSQIANERRDYLNAADALRRCARFLHTSADERAAIWVEEQQGTAYYRAHEYVLAARIFSTVIQHVLDFSAVRPPGVLEDADLSHVLCGAYIERANTYCGFLNFGEALHDVDQAFHILHQQHQDLSSETSQPSGATHTILLTPQFRVSQRLLESDHAHHRRWRIHYFKAHLYYANLLLWQERLRPQPDLTALENAFVVIGKVAQESQRAVDAHEFTTRLFGRAAEIALVGASVSGTQRDAWLQRASDALAAAQQFASEQELTSLANLRESNYAQNTPDAHVTNLRLLELELRARKALVTVQTGDLDSILRDIDQVQNQAVKRGFWHVVGRCYFLQGSIYKAQGHHEEAHRRLGNAMETFQKDRKSDQYQLQSAYAEHEQQHLQPLITPKLPSDTQLA
jgi:hypothetical protein